ncbi:MAG: hypothetical protein ACFCD0_09005 [Gemmataceae bacterium]
MSEKTPTNYSKLLTTDAESDRAHATSQPSSTCDPTNNPTPPNFTWPMRLGIGLLLFYIILPSMLSVFRYQAWTKAFGMRPRPLLTDRIYQSANSVWEFGKPWPSKKIRRKITSSDRAVKYGICWLATRCDFLEAIVGTNQSWRMFSPNVNAGGGVARIRLLYADNSTQAIRLLSDPPNLTRYCHFGRKRLLRVHMAMLTRGDVRQGFSNYLMHKYPTNNGGAKLTKIYSYRIDYLYPEPGEDYRRILSSQNGPDNWDKDGPVWCYDVEKRWPRDLDKTERKSIQGQLALAKELPEICYP